MKDSQLYPKSVVWSSTSLNISLFVFLKTYYFQLWFLYKVTKIFLASEITEKLKIKTFNSRNTVISSTLVTQSLKGYRFELGMLLFK